MITVKKLILCVCLFMNWYPLTYCAAAKPSRELTQFQKEFCIPLEYAYQQLARTLNTLQKIAFNNPKNLVPIMIKHDEELLSLTPTYLQRLRNYLTALPTQQRPKHRIPEGTTPDELVIILSSLKFLEEALSSFSTAEGERNIPVEFVAESIDQVETELKKLQKNSSDDASINRFAKWFHS